MDGITESMDMSLSVLRGLVMDREAAIHGVAKSRTPLSDSTELNKLYKILTQWCHCMPCNINLMLSGNCMTLKLTVIIDNITIYSVKSYNKL